MLSFLLPIIYLSFVSLGLPDSLLGSAWPSIHAQLGVPMSYAGIISMIISLCTVISALTTARVTARFGTGRVTAVSVVMTAAALLGFSLSNSFWQLCLLAIPYGLGAGCVDAALNNYVALHYASRHMSWLHCMWGLGTTIGPLIMGAALSGGRGWNIGYRYVGIVQLIISVVIFASLPLWKKAADESGGEVKTKALPLREAVKIPGAKEVMLSFFCYCSYEQVAILWGSSYLTVAAGMSPERAASLASLFCIGITVGRGLSGFITYKLNDTQMIRLGQTIVALGSVLMLLPFGAWNRMAGLLIVGLGCAPVYPCIIHSTPQNFGAENSQAIIGIQMASAYVGITLMPPLFGLIAQHITVKLMPVFILLLLTIGALMYESLVKKAQKKI